MNDIITYVYFVGIVYLGVRGMFTAVEDLVRFIRKKLYQKTLVLGTEQLARAKDLFIDNGSNAMWKYITSTLDLPRFTEATINMITGQMTYWEVK